MYFKWDADFLTGNEEVDAQHFQLVKIINDLLKISLSGNKVEPKKINEIQKQLAEYVVNHFSTEEQLMKQYNIDQRHWEIHYKTHQSFVRNVTHYFTDLKESSNYDKISDIIEYLIRWLAYHILNTDKSMIRQINDIENENMSPKAAYDKEENIIETSTEPLLKALKALYFLVSEKNNELETKNLELEAKVRERTLELTKVNAKLENITIHDALTGLHNRRFLMNELDRLIYQWQRYHNVFSILYLDADQFKSVNDQYGHENGDNVIKWIADFLCEYTRKSDIVCRLGGDEFVIVCPNCNGAAAMLIGEKINQLCLDDNIVGSVAFWKPSLSIGVTVVDDGIHSASEMLKKADAAMYMAKKAGGATTAFLGSTE